MKKILVIGFIIILAAAGLIALDTFTGSNEITAAGTKQETKKESKEHSCCSEDVDSEEFSENSIYQLESEWTDQDGKRKTLADFKGSNVVFTMFFASCTYACPILVEDMKKIESQIPSSELKNYKFVLISIDPERDTPAKLKEFSRMKSIDESRWTLLTATEEDVMELAALTGFKYKKENDGQFSHSNIINILNEKGEIVYQHKGLNQDVTVAANYLKN